MQGKEHERILVYWEDIHLPLLQDYICPMKVCGWQVRSSAMWKCSKLQDLTNDTEKM